MKGWDVLYALGEVPPGFLEEAEEKSMRRKGRKVILLAAAAALLTTAALASSGFGTALVERFTHRPMAPGSEATESGYVISAEVARFSTADLSPQLRDVEAQMASQFQAYKPWMSTYPGAVTKDFEDFAQAAAYLACDALQDHTAWCAPAETKLHFYGREDCGIREISLLSQKEVEGLRVQLSAHLYTAAYEGDITVGGVTTEDVTFVDSFPENRHGRTYHCVASTALKSGYHMLDGYMVEEGILYHLHVSFQSGDAETARALLSTWADQFP